MGSQYKSRAGQWQWRGFFIVEKTEVDTVVVIQLQTEKIQSCLDEMRRFEYEVLETSFEDLHVENLKVNAEYLNRYLNVWARK